MLGYGIASSSTVGQAAVALSNALDGFNQGRRAALRGWAAVGRAAVGLAARRELRL